MLLADVESSVCENYFEIYKLFEKILSRLLLFLTWYRSDSESPYLVLIAKGFAISSGLSKFRSLVGGSFLS